MWHVPYAFTQVAKESAGRFNPHVKIEAYHDNIKDPKFNVAWFKSFKIVFNALDNLEARRHVNKMCLAADVPLIESGTTGFNGQVQPIKKVRIWKRGGPDISWLTFRIGCHQMLRLRREDSAKEFRCLHHPEHPKSAHPLHSVGQELPIR